MGNYPKRPQQKPDLFFIPFLFLFLLRYYLLTIFHEPISKLELGNRDWERHFLEVHRCPWIWSHCRLEFAATIDRIWVHCLRPRLRRRLLPPHHRRHRNPHQRFHPAKLLHHNMIKYCRRRWANDDNGKRATDADDNAHQTTPFGSLFQPSSEGLVH